MMSKVMQAPVETMRTTVTLDDELLEALRALVQRESARRLAALGGSDPALEPIPRRQSAVGPGWPCSCRKARY